MGGKKTGSQIVLTQEDGEAKSQEKYNDTHETEETEGSVVPESTDDDFQGLYAIPEEVGGHPRFAMFPAAFYMDRYFKNGKLFKGQVDERFLGVGEFSKEVESLESFTAVGTEAARYIVEFLPGKAADKPGHKLVSPVFGHRHFGFVGFIDKPGCRDKIGLTVQNRLNQF